MKFTSEDTIDAVQWINEQFDRDGRFPARCTLNEILTTASPFYM